MRVVAHVSDLHFGRLDQSTLPALAQAITATQPDALVVSGDVTQRAQEREFAEARAFLDSIPCPKIIVPGNHDIPLFNVVARAFRPLARFKRHFGNDIEPFYADDEIAIAGLNTARALSFKGGRINAMQTARACSRFAALGQNLMRIVVTHHPFDLPDKRNVKDLVGRARMAIDAFARCHVDILLSGHMHVGNAEESTVRYKMSGHSMLLVQAGTASSSRLRGEANSCNIVRIDRPRVAIERLVWDDDRRDFALARSDRFGEAQSERLGARRVTRLQTVRLLGAGTAVLATMLFITVAAATVSGAMRACDDWIRAASRAWASDDATSLAHGLSFVGSVPIWLAVTLACVAVFWRLGWRHAAGDLALVMAGAVVLGNALKLLFARARPEAFFGELPMSHSFPSGHALFNACLYVALACLIEARTTSRVLGVALWVGAISIAGAIGLSRIYLGVHYPSDVAAGYLVAAGWIGAVTAVRASAKT